jgi:hypothetical protein
MKHGFALSSWTYLKRYLRNLCVLIIAGSICWVSFRFISGTALVRSVVKIILCSLIANGVFVAAFFLTPEFQKLKQIAGNVRSILLKR